MYDPGNVIIIDRRSKTEVRAMLKLFFIEDYKCYFVRRNENTMT